MTAASPTYAPTQTPGDTRRRTRYLGIRIPHDGTPSVEVLEQDVIRTRDGTEKVLEDLPGFSFPIRPASAVPWRAPVDDHLMTDDEVSALLSLGCTDALSQTAIYSRVRYEQLARDAAQEATP